MQAAYGGNLEVTRLLLDRSADPNQARTDNGCTALMAAAQDGHLEVAAVGSRHQRGESSVSSCLVRVGRAVQQQPGDLEVAAEGSPHQRGVSSVGACLVRVGRAVQQQPGDLEVAAVCSTHPLSFHR